MYNITDYSYKQAKALGVDIKPSTNKKKKIDVFKDGEKVASIGAVGYNDYPSYIRSHGKEYAEQRRKLYKIRHSKEINVVGSNGWYASILLW